MECDYEYYDNNEYVGNEGYNTLLGLESIQCIYSNYYWLKVNYNKYIYKYRYIGLIHNNYSIYW